MSEEHLSPEGENTEVETQIRLTSAEEGVNIADAKTVRLEVTGETQLVGAIFELALEFIQMTGGYVDRAMNENGDDITDRFRAPVVDPFDFDFSPGDDPVA